MTPEELRARIEQLSRQKRSRDREGEQLGESMPALKAMFERLIEKAPDQLVQTDWHETRREPDSKRPDDVWRAAGFMPRDYDAVERLLCDRQEQPQWWAVFDQLARSLDRHPLASAFDMAIVWGLIGPNGSGKTVMSCALAREACRRRATCSVRYVTAPDLIRRLHTARFKHGDDGAEMDRFKKVGLLVIDEAHERVDSDFEDRRLIEIVNNRYGHGRDTVLVSNLEPAAFSLALGPAIIDRMRQCGGFVECNWASFRRRVAPPATTLKLRRGESA